MAYEEAKAKLEQESKEGTYDRYAAAMKGAVLEVVASMESETCMLNGATRALPSVLLRASQANWAEKSFTVWLTLTAAFFKPIGL